MNFTKQGDTTTNPNTLSTNDTPFNATAQANMMGTYPVEGDSFMLVGYILIGIIGLLGNGLVIVVIGSSKKMRGKLINYFFLNQSAIDLAASIMLIITGVLNYGLHLRAEDFRGLAAQVYCKIFTTEGILYGLLASSTYNLLALTVERYLEIVKPIWHKIHYTRKVAVVKMAACWVFGQVYVISDTAGTSSMVDGQCLLFSVNTNEQTVHLMAFIVLIIDYILPIGVIVGCYTGIAVTLRSRVDAKREANSSSDMMARAHRNTLKTLVVVSVCFAVCWLYITVQYFLDRFGALPDSFSTSPLGQLAAIAACVNSCINPFIYSLQYKEFQMAMKKLFGCKQQGNLTGNTSALTTVTN